MKKLLEMLSSIIVLGLLYLLIISIKSGYEEYQMDERGTEMSVATQQFNQSPQE